MQRSIPNDTFHTSDNPNPRGIATAVECLKDGGIIIYPTDTVYTIGCDIFQQRSVERIAQIKNINIKKQNFHLYVLT